MTVPPAQQTPIAVVMTSFDAGGTERQTIELARRLDRRHWDVRLACLNPRGAWQERAAEAAPVTAFPISGFGRADTCRQALAFARWCGRHDIQIVHTVDFYSNVFALPAAAFARVRVRIGSRRGQNVDRSPAQLAMQRAAYLCAHTVVANSRASAARLVSERVRTAGVHVIPNGLDLTAFPPAGARASRRHVLTVANLRPEKGYDVLVDAAALVLQQFPDARFQCVGDGPERARIETRMAERRVSHAFSLLGPQEDVAARLALADIFVLPSRTESMPNALLEAMAAGLPVVASAVGGIPEVVDAGRTGLLYNANDPRQLADYICQLMNDAAFADALGDCARSEVHSRYSIDSMVSAFESLYLRELQARGRMRTEMAA
jgi:glycosyltransferase involved in cell wall biosynthesis